MLRMHHARLRFSPSRWTSCGSVRSVTVAGVNSAFGSPLAAPGRNRANQARNSAGGQHAPHQVGLDQARREEVGTDGSQPGRGVGVRAEVGPRPLLDQCLEPRVADRPGVVVGEREPERGVGVHAGPDRVRLLGEEFQVARDDRVRQRPEVLRPRLRVRVVPAVELLGELEQPGPAIGPLERLALLAGEVVGLGLEVLGRQVLVPALARISRRLRAGPGNAGAAARASSGREREECQSYDP